ncbi:MAG: TPM domain-containing protein [Syntrophorhabdaceae bacterium]|nr:TPM domain-containing protein [Syntrophorhabdaceae bacterium]
MKALHFFSDAEKERIREATSSAELRTIGEIAVMVVDASSRYREAEVLGAITLGNVAAFLIATFFLHESLLWYIPLTFVFFLLSWPLFRKVPLLKVHFTGVKRRQRAVRDRAVRAFYEKGLYRTRANTGVLFFISLFERKVWVLADKGIHEKITQARLDTLAKMVSRGVRERNAANALVEAIGEAGQLLEEHFPIGREGDTNELADEVIIGAKPD